MNKNLKKPAYDNRDEYYTTAETAYRMLDEISDSEFYGKVVYCNCDGPESEIYKLLKSRYKQYKLKKLVATKYCEGGRGLKTEYDGNVEKQQLLDGDGSYCSPECEELLRSSDIVATNPPFSKLSHFLSYVQSHGADLIAIVNMLAMAYKANLPLTLSGKASFSGVTRPGGSSFIASDGKLVIVKVSSITTLKSNHFLKWKRMTFKEFQQLGKEQYDDQKHMLVVDQCRNIPVDYNGEMLVPITMCFCPNLKEKHDILGLADWPIKVNGKNKFYRVRIQRKAEAHRAASNTH